MILGIWDGHDAGACIVSNGKIISAANEERFTGRKLEPLFPFNSINFCLNYIGINPENIKEIAFSTSDFSLTLTRLMPSLKDNYWYVRERLVKERLSDATRIILTKTGEIMPNKLFKVISERIIKKELKRIGFKHKYNISLIEHHLAHAASAYYTSGMNNALCVTMDGLGDGISSTINLCDKGKIQRITANRTCDSLGLFYQEVTYLLGMRILEDECKVMALADYSKPLNKNEMLSLFEIDGLNLKAVYSPLKRYEILKKMLGKHGKIKFCWMAQKALEYFASKMIINAIKETGTYNVVWSGGVASNIKMNMAIRQNTGVKRWFIFPHMGDGGLAAGAALQLSNDLYGTKPYKMDSVYLGPSFNEKDIKKVLSGFKNKLKWNVCDEPELDAAEEICKNKIVFWFQNKMEYGPRALGNRSIICRTDKIKFRNNLNSLIKRRDWFQPFCPSVLQEDAKKIFHDVKQHDKFMTMGFLTKQEMIEKLKAVISIDNSGRPQMIGNENKKFRNIIKAVKRTTGIPAILNTSFNIHGYPLVCSPKDAISTFLKVRGESLFIENFHIKIK